MSIFTWNFSYDFFFFKEKCEKNCGVLCELANHDPFTISPLLFITLQKLKLLISHGSLHSRRLMQYDSGHVEGFLPGKKGPEENLLPFLLPVL